MSESANKLKVIAMGVAGVIAVAAKSFDSVGMACAKAGKATGKVAAVDGARSGAHQ